MKRRITRAQRDAVEAAVADCLDQRVEDLEIAENPWAAGTYAVRAHTDAGATRGFLLLPGRDLRTISSDDLVEVTYTRWPPYSD